MTACSCAPRCLRRSISSSSLLNQPVKRGVASFFCRCFFVLDLFVVIYEVSYIAYHVGKLYYHTSTVSTRRRANCKTHERRSASPRWPIFGLEFRSMEPPCISFQPETGLNMGLPLIHSEFCNWLEAYCIFCRVLWFGSCDMIRKYENGG